VTKRFGVMQAQNLQWVRNRPARSMAGGVSSRENILACAFVMSGPIDAADRIDEGDAIGAQQFPNLLEESAIVWDTDMLEREPSNVGSHARHSEKRRLAAPGEGSEAQRQDSAESNEGQQGQDQGGLRVVAHGAPQAGKSDADHMGRAGVRDRRLRIRGRVRNHRAFQAYVR